MTSDTGLGGTSARGNGTMADADGVEVVVAHRERVTLRVGDVFLKIDADRARLDREAEAMVMAPIPTPDVLWPQPSVLALSAVRGSALGRLGAPSDACPGAWAAAGAAVRKLHDAPPPPWPGRDLTIDALRSEIRWLAEHGFDPFAPGCEVDVLRSRT